jgi:serine/threonine protein kinase
MHPAPRSPTQGDTPPGAQTERLTPTYLTLTGTHEVMGTLLYMAPEQMKRTHTVDHRADIYSLGVVLYEMLTGELPLGRFAPPSHKAAVDERLDQVVLRALAREPAERYQDASAFKQDVVSALAAAADAPGRASVNRMRQFPSRAGHSEGLRKRLPTGKQAALSQNRLFWLVFASTAESSVYRRVEISYSFRGADFFSTKSLRAS